MNCRHVTWRLMTPAALRLHLGKLMRTFDTLAGALDAFEICRMALGHAALAGRDEYHPDGYGPSLYWDTRILAAYHLSVERAADECGGPCRPVTPVLHFPPPGSDSDSGMLLAEHITCTGHTALRVLRLPRDPARIRLTLPQACAVAQVFNSPDLDPAVGTGMGVVFARCSAAGSRPQRGSRPPG